MQLKPLILIMIIFVTIVSRAVTTLHIASTNLKLNFLDVLVIHASLFYIIMSGALGETLKTSRSIY